MRASPGRRRTAASAARRCSRSSTAKKKSKFDVPSGFFEIGLGMCIPTVTHYASKDVAARYVKPALYGEEIWCQLFSEPSAGSDVAGLRTRAEKDGDDWVINGQKIWTSGAHYSDYGILLTRTDPNAQKHKGLTMFYLSMKSPGVEVQADQANVGRRELQRSVLHQRAHSGCPAPRRSRRGLGRRADHADA